MFVAQLGILYAEGDTDEESETLRASLREAYTPLQAFCMMLFCLLSVPCFATLAVMKRELNSRSNEPDFVHFQVDEIAHTCYCMWNNHNFEFRS